ncbi:MAG TPA: CRISPR-associated protein [Desulfobacterales bacterium]|nr:CRISPR-associated protein [Desulfobacterales bacterium]
MPRDTPLAHSPRKGIPAQTYFKHISNVRRQAISNAQRARAFYNGDHDAFIDWIEAASVYHDLGKLDTENQSVLENDSRKPLPVAHDDAGVAELDKLGRQEAAALAYAHHAGLFSRDNELAKQGRPFRQLNRTTPQNEIVADHVDRELENYERVHAASKCPVLDQVEPSGLHGCGFTRRVALSCLVDADHGDTARHYGNEVEIPEIKPGWTERLSALQRYVDQLPEGNTEREQHRNRLRKRLFESCRDATLDLPIRTCDAPVGSGKTTAVIAHLLRVAAERKPALRHIIVVLPYTNIITQSVETYRKALVLEGERPEDVVAEHHHRADFADLEARQLATLWKAPIIVTTAVQFFETIGSNHPAQLRKLHELPGSAVFVDETHAAIPSHLWPQMWRWLETWTRDWGGHLVLASGSLPRFWELAEYKDLIRADDQRAMPEVPDLVTDDSLRNELNEAEERRIKYRRRPEDASALDCHGVVEFVVEKEPGPRLLIVNTVHTAAVIAQAIDQSGHDVLHLSTALAPVHRDLIVERIKRLLQDGTEDWTLVATSCVEAGMDFSFRVGFRERASTASLIQIGGRVSRADEFNDAEVWDILLRDDRFRDNPSVLISRQALDRFSLRELNKIHPAELASFAMRREWTCGADERARKLIEDENRMEYPSVSKQCRVIDTDTRTVIIDGSLAEAVRKGEKVSRHELMRYSVQIWADKIKKLALQPAIPDVRSDDSRLYVWQYDYDPDFLGYMKGVLKLENFIASGGAVI